MLKNICGFEQLDLHYKSFSFRILDIYDHWLTEEEALKDIISYPVFLYKGRDLNLYYEKEALFVDLFKEILANYKILHCYDGIHKKVKNFKNFEPKLKRGLREIDQMFLHINALELIIVSNFDLTMCCYFADEAYIPPFEKIVKKFSGIYLRE